MSESNYQVIKSDGAPIKAWTQGVPVESAAIDQLRNIASLPFIYKWVAAMPDVHLGIGATVGSVIATDRAIVPAAVGVDIGCFTGDTRVPLYLGQSRSLEELVQYGKPFYVHSVDTRLHGVAGRATALKTRTDAALVRVTLSNGEQITCTPDHLFMHDDGSYKPASALAAGDSLLVRNDVTGVGCTVQSVEPLIERADVYCLQVEQYHNFALAAGVYVHNCGMVAAQTNLVANDLPDNLHGVRESIEQSIPVGTPSKGAAGKGSWSDAPQIVRSNWVNFEREYERLLNQYGSKLVTVDTALGQLGTLGSGNHFCELCLDEDDNVWLMLHSGSRGLGNRIGSYFIELAKRDMEQWMIHLPDKDLAYFPEGSEHFREYLDAVEFAQRYARVNRDIMLWQALGAVRKSLNRDVTLVEETATNCHHNYVAKESHYGKNVLVTRKGAVRAREGDMAVIPGSMGTRSYIVRGKGNPESFYSCSHGAGRAMSRGEAKRRFTVEDHVQATQGIECRKDAGVLDETPGAYKDINAVMQAQEDLVEIVHELRQVVCVKG